MPQLAKLKETQHLELTKRKVESLHPSDTRTDSGSVTSLTLSGVKQKGCGRESRQIKGK